jgi:membrane fusion protein (multidrug efflux system)
VARKIAITVLALVVVVIVLGGIKGLQISALIAQGKSFAPPPEAVTATTVKTEDWEPTLTAVGSVVAAQGVTVSAEGSGVVRKIAFESGAVVRQGALLVQLDTATEQAELASAEAAATLKKLTLERNQKLLESGAIAKAALDTAEAEAQQTRAQVNNIRASIAKKTIRAPFSGRLGIRQVNLGEFLNSGAPIVSLQSFDPILVDFSLPQQHLSTVKTGQTVRVTTDAFPGEEFTAKLTAINPDVDTATRNVRMQASLSNPEGRLRPGMFVDVTAVFPTRKPVLSVPATAVIYAPYGDSVYVIEEQRSKKDKAKTTLVVRQQFVRFLVILIAGIQAIRSLNVRQYPRSENATVTVTTAYIGASAELVRGFITQPLERAIAAADGIEYLQSSSKLGLSTITARLEAELRRDEGVVGNQFQGGSGPARSAARSGSAGHQRRIRRHALRLGLSQFHLGHSRSEPNHRLPRACRAAATQRLARRATRRFARRAHLCDAHLAQGGSARRARHQSERSPTNRSPRIISSAPSAGRRVRSCKSTSPPTPICVRGRVQATSCCGRTATRSCG